MPSGSGRRGFFVRLASSRSLAYNPAALGTRRQGGTRNAMKPEQEHGEAPLFHRLLIGLVTRVARRPRTVLAAMFCLCALSLAASWTRLSYRSQRDDLISP